MSTPETHNATAVTDWITSLGFIQGSPFALNEAEQERELLPDFFVEFDNFEYIKDQKTAIVFAHRGGGKSALRVYLANLCAGETDDYKPLMVEYTHFQTLIQKHQLGQALVIQDHLQPMLRAGALVLLKALFGEVGRNFRVPTIDIETVSISPTAWLRLAAYLRQFAPRALAPETIYDYLTHLAPPFNLDWNTFLEAYHAQKLGKVVAQSPTLREHTPSHYLANLSDTAPHPLEPTRKTFKRFINLAYQFEFSEVQFLIDRLDEYPETVNDPQAQADILEPLLLNLHILELEGVAFKFFLPKTVRDALVKRNIRRDRLGDFISVQWKPEQLTRLLYERLSVYSDTQIRDFSLLFKQLPEAQAVEQEMVRLAQGSPRRLLMAGKLLLEAHLTYVGAQGLLTYQDWEHARNALMKRMPPLLQIFRDQRAINIRGERVEFTKQEHKIIIALVDRDGVCSREALVKAVWGVGEGVSDQAIDQAIMRIRKKMKDQGQNPVYIKTEKHSGFRLMNYEAY